MKVLYKSPGGRYTVEFEGNDTKELWRKIADFASIFEMYGTHCGVETTLVARTTPGGSEFFEKKCPKCGQSFSYSVHKQNMGGGLYPNTKKGWHKWVPEDKIEDSSAPFETKKAASSKGNGKK